MKIKTVEPEIASVQASAFTITKLIGVNLEAPISRHFL